ncbi:MAG: hypothetical protein MOGMAGMI_01173 [Candidatus Omnitrophica bacterium]|nr:hypothetical protein [Candidatus Omnitrophota bacterium]
MVLMRRKRGWVFTLSALAGLWWVLSMNYELPILMYHIIDRPPAEGRSSVHVSPEVFERQMEFLKVHGYRVIPLSEAVRLYKEGRPIPRKTVVITFDDGTLDNFDHAFPVLRKMDFPATIFMITSNIGQEGWLGEQDLKILDQSGIEIGSHTADHAFLPSLKNDAEIEDQLLRSKARLEEVLGHPVSLLSYPAGGFNSRIAALAQLAGYEGAVTTNHGRPRGNPYGLHRIKVSESGANLFNFWLKVSGLYHLGKRRIAIS